MNAKAKARELQREMRINGPRPAEKSAKGWSKPLTDSKPDALRLGWSAPDSGRWSEGDGRLPASARGIGSVSPREASDVAKPVTFVYAPRVNEKSLTTGDYHRYAQGS